MPGQVHFTDAEIDALKRVLHTTDGPEIAHVLEKLGKLPKARLRPFAERLAHAEKLLADGTPVTTAAGMAQLSYSTLRKHFPEARAWTPREAGEYGLAVRQLSRL